MHIIIHTQGLDSPDSSPRNGNPHYFSPVYHRKGRMVAHAPPGSYIGRVTKGRFQLSKVTRSGVSFMLYCFLCMLVQRDGS